jgi:D-alanyl-D-alanine carboxypeptidase (penicillin-binding protein 5/6)
VSLRDRRAGALAASIAAALALSPGASRAAAPPDIHVRASALIDASTGQQLYGVNAGAELPVASATKLMTALVALEHARLDRVLAAPSYQLAAVDSQIGLQPRERASVADLVAAMMLPSADDAAYDLAYNVGGHSVARFIGMMNAEAARLGLTHTHYSTPVGLDTPGNYSAASDLVALARYVLRSQPFIRRVVAMPTARIRVGGQRRTVTNLNTLVGRVPWVTGVKTGHTLEAGYVLVGSGRRDGLTLISAVLGATSETARESDTLALLKWGFANFRLAAPVSSGRAVGRRPVRGHQGLEVALLATGSFRRVVARSTPVTMVVDAPRRLTGPLRKGAPAGTVVVLEGGMPIARIPLTLARAVPAPPSSLSPTTVAAPFTLVVIVLLLGVAVVRSRRQRAGAGPSVRQRQE